MIFDDDYDLHYRDDLAMLACLLIFAYKKYELSSCIMCSYDMNVTLTFHQYR